ncbi:hypothetical protein NIES4106_47310 [Fischerella sp. NIES-4106]|jgi:hypothetical protein|nr:hypothetical protein NIES4106_47310 [Fischerella sp. NIES-4106]
MSQPSPQNIQDKMLLFMYGNCKQGIMQQMSSKDLNYMKILAKTILKLVFLLSHGLLLRSL